MLFYYIMWLRIRRDWSTQCVCVLKFMCFFSICVCAACELKWCHMAQDPMSSEPITRNHSSQTTTNSICLPLLHALNGLDIHGRLSSILYVFHFVNSSAMLTLLLRVHIPSKAGKAKYIFIKIFLPKPSPKCSREFVHILVAVFRVAPCRLVTAFGRYFVGHWYDNARITKLTVSLAGACCEEFFVHCPLPVYAIGVYAG